MTDKKLSQVKVMVAITVENLLHSDPEELRKDLGERVYATALRKLPPPEKDDWVED